MIDHSTYLTSNPFLSDLVPKTLLHHWTVDQWLTPRKKQGTVSQWRRNLIHIAGAWWARSLKVWAAGAVLGEAVSFCPPARGLGEPLVVSGAMPWQLMPCRRFQALYKIREPFTIYLGL